MAWKSLLLSLQYTLGGNLGTCYVQPTALGLRNRSINAPELETKDGGGGPVFWLGS